MSTGNRDTAALRAENTARVLTEIRLRRETSRVDLARVLNLSATTVSAVVAELVEQGLIQETHAMASQGRGRPKMQVSLNASARYVAGAKLNTGSVTVSVLNFVGEVLADTVVPVAGHPIAADMLRDALRTGFDHAVVKAGLQVHQIRGIGLAVPGFVERETGFCHWCPLLKDGALDLTSVLQPALPCPLVIDNDANLATLAELWFGHGRKHRDFIVVTIEHGVGMGVVIDGQVYRGARGLGAEFGHTKVQVDGGLCRCGQRGCLEAYVADFALVREAEAALQGRALPSEPGALIDLLADRARAGEAAAVSIFGRAGRMLGLGLGNLLNLFDPGVIVLAGERMRNFDLMQTALEETLRASALRTDRPAVELAVHRWGDGLWARGAGALAVEAFALSGDKSLVQTGPC